MPYCSVKLCPEPQTEVEVDPISGRLICCFHRCYSPTCQFVGEPCDVYATLFLQLPNGREAKVCAAHSTLDAWPTRYGREGDSQPLPKLNDLPDIQSMVIADIEARRQVGIERYGTALQPNNGRNALQDLYEELVDAAMYIKQFLVEQDLAKG